MERICKDYLNRNGVYKYIYNDCKLMHVHKRFGSRVGGLE